MRKKGQSVSVGFVLVVAEEADDGIGDLIAFGLLFLVIAGTAACFLTVWPVFRALRHGWRWTLAVVAATVACGLPLRRMYAADDIAGEAWGLVSFPLWIALAILARRGPPAWLPVLRANTADRL